MNRVECTQEQVINYLNPVIRGWGNYYQYVVSKEAFSYFDWMVHQALTRWAFRRHPKKSKQWVINKYFPSDGFIFSAEIEDRTRISHQDFNNKPKMPMLSGFEVKYPSKSCHDLYARLKRAKSMQDKGFIIAMQKLWLR
jgi:hypothetical protein